MQIQVKTNGEKKIFFLFLAGANQSFLWILNEPISNVHEKRNRAKLDEAMNIQHCLDLFMCSLAQWEAEISGLSLILGIESWRRKKKKGKRKEKETPEKAIPVIVIFLFGLEHVECRRTSVVFCQGTPLRMRSTSWSPTPSGQQPTKTRKVKVAINPEQSKLGVSIHLRLFIVSELQRVVPSGLFVCAPELQYQAAESPSFGYFLFTMMSYPSWKCAWKEKEKEKSNQKHDMPKKWRKRAEKRNKKPTWVFWINKESRRAFKVSIKNHLILFSLNKNHLLLLIAIIFWSNSHYLILPSDFLFDLNFWSNLSPPSFILLPFILQPFPSTMKLFERCVPVFHPWTRVSLASWVKYPNDNSAHVLHVDYLSTSVDPATGVLTTERLLTCKQNVPSVIEWVI